MKKINFSKISKLVPILGLIVFIYIILDIGIYDIISAFLKIPILYFLLASLFTIPRLILYIIKWKYICDKQKFDLKISFISKTFLITFFYATITPGAIGFHLRAYYVKRKSNATLGKCLANSFIDHQIGYIAGIFLALIGSIIIFDKIPSIFPIILAFFILHAGIFIVLIRKKRGKIISRFLIKPIIPKRYRESFDNSVDSLYEDILPLRNTILPFIIELGIFFIAGLQVYIISIAFGVNIPFYLIILISIISTIFVGIIPISIGGLGVREGAFVFIMQAFGVEPGIAFVISLGGFIVKTLIPSIIGLILSITYNEA
jgi:glycosyltransferase 2 family protein